ncbi:transposase [Arthrobacter sp. GAS37]|uniref:hypothetical protein n=1 Tax=Arthrobacter sp. GAS37 TaxID=3156261 RepID=UPI0038360033
MATETTNVIAGTDTHHVAVINEHRKPLADKEFLAVGSGYRKIVEFITSHGTVTAVGVGGTGSYGAEIARTLRGEGLCVLEVNRPNRAAPAEGQIRSAGRPSSRSIGTRRPDQVGPEG